MSRIQNGDNSAMTDEMTALGRRAVACKGWRWMPGMRAYGPHWGPLWEGAPPTSSWYARVEQDGDHVGIRDDGPHIVADLSITPEGTVPDLSDHATLGCLLAQVRVAWGDPNIGIIRWDGGAAVVRFNTPPVYCYDDIDSIAEGNSEAEALCAAMEVAP